MRRWLPVTEAAVREDPEARDIAQLVRDLARQVRRRWVPAADLPVHLVHGDVRLSNVRRKPAGETAYFDFGFLARRPRIRDLAYALAFTVWALDALQAPGRFPWDMVPRLIEAYEATTPARLTAVERTALLPHTAAVPLYYAAPDGFTEDPAGRLRSRLPFLRLSAWLLDHPTMLGG